MSGIAVYMLIDKYDRPIYVGASRNVDRRAQEHRQKPWWPQVVTVEMYPMATWEQALSVERGAIARLNPEFNRQSTNADARYSNAIRGALLRDLDQVVSA